MANIPDPEVEAMNKFFSDGLAARAGETSVHYRDKMIQIGREYFGEGIQPVVTNQRRKRSRKPKRKKVADQGEFNETEVPTRRCEKGKFAKLISFLSCVHS